MKIELVIYDQEYLELSWVWLNDPEIKALTNTPDFTKEDQTCWFNSLKNMPDYLIWGILVDDIKIGVCGLKNLTDNDCEYWTFIGEKNYWGKGIGTRVLELLIEISKALNLSSMWLSVLENNYPALNLYKSIGFVMENQIEKLVYMRKSL